MNAETLERELFRLISEFSVSNMPIGGRFYFRGMRPIADNKSGYSEDIVVGFLAGSGNDMQSGDCLVNVYVSDIQARSGVYYKNKERCEEIASLLEKFPAYATQHGALYVRFVQNDMICTIEESDIHQHFVSLKMRFHVLNENY